MKEFGLLAFALGMMVGAYVVTTSKNAQEMVEKGSKAVKKQIKKMTK